MLRRITNVPGGIAHYVVGSVYVMGHLVTYEWRTRGLLGKDVTPAQAG
jgi:hypothetical protein